MIKNIGALAGTAWSLRLAINKEYVPNKSNVVIGIPLEEALEVHSNIMSIVRNSGADEVMVPVLIRSASGPEYRTMKIDIPVVPERDAGPWLCLFDIEVFVT